jgi:hypothetical protein
VFSRGKSLLIFNFNHDGKIVFPAATTDGDNYQVKFRTNDVILLLFLYFSKPLFGGKGELQFEVNNETGVLTTALLSAVLLELSNYSTLK